MLTRAAAAREAALSAPGASKRPLLNLGGKGNAIATTEVDVNEGLVETAPEAVSRNKRKHAASKTKKALVLRAEPVKGGWHELPHNMGSMEGATNDQLPDKDILVANDSRLNKRARRELAVKSDEVLEITENPPKISKKSKANPYGLTPGRSPFPDFVMPTSEACKQVEDALSEVHGKVEAPKEIPAPSLEVTGCGEVPSVLDALIRTLLSASTTSQNAKYAFMGLVERYGVLQNGVGAGSVDWNQVRESDVLDIEKAIKKGGLAKTKSISIKKILELVYAQNLTRYDAFLKEKRGEMVSSVVGAEKMTQGQKDMEIDLTNKKILSLDFMHGLTADEAMLEFVKYPGIGVKTASCVILFCLQRPSFAVDTHVWRFCKWLGWVPEGATRDQTFSHCEVRIPNSMKYSLHQLFIRHGKTCGRCRANTGESSEGWDSTLCPLEHLVQRTGKRKRIVSLKKLTVKKGKENKTKRDNEKGEDDAELSDLTDVEESDLNGRGVESIDAESSVSWEE